MPEKREVKTPEYVINRHYERYSSSYKSKEVDNYLSNANSYYRRLCNFIDNNTSHYYVYTYYLESSQGPCKAIQLRSAKDEDHCYNIVDEYHDLKERQLKTLAEMKAEKFSFKLDYAAAMTGLLNMGFDIVRYRNYIKTYNQVLDDCFAIVDALYEEKARELAFIEWVVRNSLTLDGVVSDESNMLCPLTTDDVLPDYPLQHVSYFEFVD